MKNIIFLLVLSLFLFTSCGGDDDNSPQDSDVDGYSVNDDCDDNNAMVNPDAIEICNGIDDNCNGEVDEGCDIGDLREGGIIFYIAPVPTDLDGDGTLDYGLVCAIEDQSSGIQWYNGTKIITGATGVAIGTGLANTNAIIEFQGPLNSYAAGAARSYTDGSYTDWFLPSKDELNQMYLNKVAINTTAVANGGAAFNDNDWYWSSTEANNAAQAWSQAFSDGLQTAFGKNITWQVRAVRAF